MEMDTAGSRKELNSRKNRLHRVLDIVIAAAIGAAAAALGAVLSGQRNAAVFDAEHAIVGVKDVRGVVCFRIYPADRMNVFTAD